MNNQLLKFKDVNDIIQLLSKEIKNILEKQFVGMYIHGSLAIGDFSPFSSDIDFLVVTKDIVSKDIFDSLAKMHSRIAKSGKKWACELEGSYVPEQLLNSKESPVELRPYINGSKFCLTQYGYEWVLERYTTREYGIVIEGPNPKTLINSISSTELKEASFKILNEWWAPMLSNTSRLKDSDYQPYAILTMCRTLYMFTHGTMVSKKNAAIWAQNTLNERWKTLIKKALEWKKDSSFVNIDETIEFIKFTIEYINGNNSN